MKKALTIIIMVTVVPVVSSIIYYFAFFRAEKERVEIRPEGRQNKTRKGQKSTLSEALENLGEAIKYIEEYRKDQKDDLFRYFK